MGTVCLFFKIIK